MSIRKRIGIFGGTFDPIHQAHLTLGEIAYRQFGLDEIWFMPSKQPPHKLDKPVSPVEHRFAMVRLATADTPYFRCSGFELGLPGKSYTANTLTTLNQLYPNTQFYFIMGGDSLFALEEWYQPEVIMKQAVILAAVRENHDTIKMQEQIEYLAEKYEADIRLLYAPLMDVSSSDIRRLIRQGKEISDMLSESVERYIREQGLYTDKYMGTLEAVKISSLPETTVSEIASGLKATLKPHRYEHTLNVAVMARHLAVASGVDPEKAYLAGLLHDCAKSYTHEELLVLCSLRNIEITEAEFRAPHLLHAKYGAWMAKYVYGIDDSEICEAVLCHTTGKPGMSTLDKIVFVADYLEPGRNQAPHLHILRKLAEKDLDMTVHRILQDTLEYLREKKAQIDPKTQETFNWISEFIAEKGDNK